jgi:hypothetical protein
MDGEGEGEGDAEVVLRHGFALVDGVGLLKNLEGATPTWMRVVPGKE